MEDTIAKMRELRAQGLRFALDDFGTGHSSLSYLTQLPLDELKIDRSFVAKLGVSRSDEIVVQTILAMSERLGLTVVAEGVEVDGQLALLRGHGCRRFQGYLFAPPLSQDDFERGAAELVASPPQAAAPGDQASLKTDTARAS